MDNQTKDQAIEKAKGVEEYLHQAAMLGQGKVGSNSHPLHPSMVHWPVALLTTGFMLDGLELFRRKVAPKALTTFLPSSATNILAHYSTAGGVLFAIPAVVTGLAELYEMYRRSAVRKGNKGVAKDYYNGEEEMLQTTLHHATLNDIAIAGAAYNWWTRHKAVTSLALPTMNLWISVAALGASMYGAYLGGHLVYHHGWSVQRQGSADLKKDQ